MFESINSEISEKRRTLRNVEDDIRRLTGKNPSFYASDGSLKWKSKISPLAPGQNRKRSFPQRGPGMKTQVALEEDEEEKDSPDEDVDQKKPSIQSTVVFLQNKRSRQDSIAEQGKDKKSHVRNQRMFGVVMGTLKQFLNEESSRKDQELKRAEINKKVEEAAEREKEEVKKEKETLFLSRKKQRVELRCLEKKAEIIESYAVWEKNQKHLCNFIMTTTKPRIFYMPTRLNAKQEKAQKQTKEKLEGEIEDRHAKLEKELNEIEESYRRDDLEKITEETAGDKENIELPISGKIEDIQVQVIEPKIGIPNPSASTKKPDTSNSEDDSLSESPSQEDRSDSESSEDDSEPLPVDDNDEFIPIYD